MFGIVSSQSLDAFQNRFLFRNHCVFRADGEGWNVDDDVISRLVEDAIDSESREVLTMSRSRSV